MHNDLATFQMFQQLKTCWKDPDSRLARLQAKEELFSGYTCFPPTAILIYREHTQDREEKNIPEFYSDLSSVIGLHSLL